MNKALFALVVAVFVVLFMMDNADAAPPIPRGVFNNPITHSCDENGITLDFGFYDREGTLRIRISGSENGVNFAKELTYNLPANVAFPTGWEYIPEFRIEFWYTDKYSREFYYSRHMDVIDYCEIDNKNDPIVLPDTGCYLAVGIFNFDETEVGGFLYVNEIYLGEVYGSQYARHNVPCGKNYIRVTNPRDGLQTWSFASKWNGYLQIDGFYNALED